MRGAGPDSQHTPLTHCTHLCTHSKHTHTPDALHTPLYSQQTHTPDALHTPLYSQQTHPLTHNTDLCTHGAHRHTHTHTHAHTPDALHTSVYAPGEKSCPCHSLGRLWKGGAGCWGLLVQPMLRRVCGVVCGRVGGVRGPCTSCDERRKGWRLCACPLRFHPFLLLMWRQPLLMCVCVCVSVCVCVCVFVFYVGNPATRCLRTSRVGQNRRYAHRI